MLHRLRPVSSTRRGRLAGLLALLLGCSFAHTAYAHPISVVVETAHIDRDKITIDVEVFAEDLFFYHDLKPNERNEVPASALREAAVKHGPLLLERLPVFDMSGRRIQGGKVISVEGDAFPADIPLGEFMGHDLIYRLELPLEKPPEFLSFSQRLVDGDAGFPALVDFRAKQAGLEEEIEATLKPRDVRTIRFDWSPEDPKASEGSSREEWLEARREDLLGATSLNTVRSFLYITRREVRHELLIPFPLVESYFTVDRADADTLTPSEQDIAKAKAAEFFSAKNPLSIDGVPHEPSATRVEFFTLEDRDLTKPPKRRTVSAVNSRIGIVLSYPLAAPASEVELVWDAFNRQAWRVDAFCFAGSEILRPKFSMATRSDTFAWKRPQPIEPTTVEVVEAPRTQKWSIPWLAIGIGGVGIVAGLRFRRRPALAGAVIAASVSTAAAVWTTVRVNVTPPLPLAPIVSADEASEIFHQFHRNLYLSVEATTDEEALDLLAASADGELLRDLYLRLVRSFRVVDDSGTLPIADEINILRERKIGAAGRDGGFDYSCIWEVTGRVEHWGHVHSRRYRYEGEFRIEPRDGQWKMTSLDLRDARIVEDEAVGLL